MDEMGGVDDMFDEMFALLEPEEQRQLASGEEASDMVRGWRRQMLPNTRFRRAWNVVSFTGLLFYSIWLPLLVAYCLDDGHSTAEEARLAAERPTPRRQH